MLILRDNIIRKRFDKDNEWKDINDDQYIDINCDENILNKKMFPDKKDLKLFYQYRKKWFEQDDFEPCEINLKY